MTPEECSIMVRPVRRLGGPIRHRARCSCGWISAWYPARENADQAAHRHVLNGWIDHHARI